MAFIDAEGPLQERIIREYEIRYKRTGTPLPFSLDESLQIIIDVTDFYPRTTIIFDGIDEIVETEKTRLAVIKGIQKIVKESEGLVKVFFSSRFEADITSNDNQGDIALFVTKEVANLISDGELLGGDVEEDFQEFICRRISILSHGM